MTDTDFQQLDGFVHYAQKRFKLSLLSGFFDDGRHDPDIPSRSIGLSLLLDHSVHLVLTVSVLLAKGICMIPIFFGLR